MLLGPIIFGLAAFAISLVVLMVIEKIIHRLTRNPFKTYRWGVWLLALLIGVWTFVTSLGR